MYVPRILPDGALLTWFKSIRTIFGKLKKKKSGQAVKPTTARQERTLRSFKFLEAHLTIRTDTRQLGKVLLPPDVEEEADDDDAVSLGSAHSSSQLPSAQHVSSRPQSSRRQEAQGSKHHRQEGR